MNKLIVLLWVLSGPLLAQDAVEHASQAVKAVKASVAAGAEKAEAAVKTGVAKADNATQAAVQEAVVMVKPLEILKENRFKKIHNKIVHFPIALGIFGAFFLLLSYRYPSYKWPARILLFFAGLAAALALPTGEAQEAAFDGTSLVQVLAWHETAGKVCLGLIWGAFVLSFFQVTRKFFWLYALALIGALALAGALGGILAAS